ncbi:hypothetical protein Tco_0559271 [Tanacetum coccineum]
MDKRKKHFAKLRAEEIRRKPPTKAQKRNQMCTYLKNMANYKHSQLKNKSFEEIQMLFDNTMKWVDSFIPMDTEVVEGSKSQAEGSKKRTREELESDNSKKQKIDENEKAEVDDEAKMIKLIEIVPDDEVAIDAIPLATNSPIIVDWKIIKEEKMGYFQIIRADGSSRRYSSMIRMLQNIDREDLETLWKLVKAKHGNTRPEEAYERVLWDDLKVMFEPDVESEVWRNLQEKKYPLTPETITKMLNKKLQTDHWNEMCYQLLKLMTKQVKNLGISAAGIKLMLLLTTAEGLQLLKEFLLMDGGEFVDIPWHVVKFLCDKAKGVQKRTKIVGAHLIRRIVRHLGELGIVRFNVLGYAEIVDDKLDDSNKEVDTAEARMAQEENKGSSR